MVHTISATVMNIRSHIKKHINAGASVVSTLPNPQDNYYYFLYAYNLYVREQLFCIWRECSCMIDTKVHLLISDLEYQISSYAKTKILKYVIRYESTLIDKIITKKSQLSNDYILIYEFSNSEEWVSYLFDKYPILEEILDNYTTNILNYVRKLLIDYSSERDALRSWIDNPSALTKIDLFLGDSHNKGQSVVCFNFPNQDKVIYKPRVCSNEMCFNKFIQYLHKMGFSIKCEVPEMKVYDDHTWVKYITVENCDIPLDRYYENLGKLFCILYSIGASDIIPDNIISSGGKPYLIDLEVIRPYVFVRNFENSTDKLLRNSVLGIGVLPRWEFTSPNERDAISSVLLQGKDNKHLPRVNGEYVAITYDLKQNFIDGFNICYDYLLKHDIQIKQFAFENNAQRIIFHDTIIYSFLLKELTLPETLCGKRNLEYLLKQIVNISEGISSIEKDAIVDSLKTQLMNYDIPYFMVSLSEGSLFDGSQKLKIKDFISRQNIIERVLSKQDKSIQNDIISKSIDCAFEQMGLPVRCPVRLSTEVRSTDTKELCLQSATIIAEDLLNRAIDFGDEINWIGKNSSRLDDKYQVDGMNASLYNGTVGISSFFNELSRYSDNTSFSQISSSIYKGLLLQYDNARQNKIFENLIRKSPGMISYHAFPISLIYLIFRLDDITCCSKIINDIIDLVDGFLLKQNTNYGYLGGLTGYLDVLIELCLNDVIPVDSQQIKNAEQLLLSNSIVDNNKRGWIHRSLEKGIVKENMLGGFSHGSSGIAYILYRLYRLTGKEYLFEIFQQTLEHDRSLFNKSINGWVDVRNIGNSFDMGGWCHGAGGVALSRLLMLNYGYRDELLIDEIKNSVSILKNRMGSNLCICHGDMGNLEILYAIGRFLDDKELQTYVLSNVNKIATDLISGGNIICGDRKVLPLDGLFLGISGVAYQMLRFADWENVPSLLTLELSTNSFKKVLH